MRDWAAERRKRKKGLDYLQPRLNRLIQTIESLPEPKVDSKNPTYPLRRKQAHRKIRQDLERLIQIAAGDILDTWALAGIINILRRLLPLDKEWQQVHVKYFARTEKQTIIIEENTKLDAEEFQKWGRSKEILRRSPRLQELTAHRSNPEDYITGIIRKYCEK